jgi:hypothetical protein
MNPRRKMSIVGIEGKKRRNSVTMPKTICLKWINASIWRTKEKEAGVLK